MTGRPIAIDLFCGAGGFSLGAAAAGFRIAAAVDNDPQACASYNNNLVATGRADVVQKGDLSKLTAADIRSLSPVLNERGCDLIIGGPPCQGFSRQRLNSSGVLDPRNGLLINFFNIVANLKPKYFLVENVPGMLWPRHRKWLDHFFNLAREAGYEVDLPIELNAADYGVPQRRRRVFILGRHAEAALVNFPPPKTHANPQSRNGPATHWINCESAFNVVERNNDPNNVHMNHKPELIAAFENTPINGGSRRDSGRLLKCHVNHDGHSDVYGRIDPAGVAPTMTTACINPSKGRFVHPTHPHGITARQAARIQTFPNWFEFSGGLMAAGNQIGNAVPPVLAEALLLPFARSLSDLALDPPSSVLKNLAA